MKFNRILKIVLLSFSLKYIVTVWRLKLNFKGHQFNIQVIIIVGLTNWYTRVRLIYDFIRCIMPACIGLIADDYRYSCLVMVGETGTNKDFGNKSVSLSCFDVLVIGV